jgi:hypothetical protein
MEIYNLIARLTICCALIAAVVMLCLQVAAFRRHGHKSFLILAVSSISGIIYIAVSAPAYFLGIDLPTVVLLTKVATIPQATTLVLSIWGTASLFNSYRQLAGHASQRIEHNDP